MANAVKSPCGFCGVGLDAAAPTKTILSSKLHSICADNYTLSINALPSFMNAPRDAKNVVLANLKLQRKVSILTGLDKRSLKRMILISNAL